MNLRTRIKRRIESGSIPSTVSLCRQLSRWWYPDIDTERMLDADWDYLLLLDACRADTFESVSDLPGETSRTVTGASMTVEWLENHVADTELHDIVYITGNQQVVAHQSRLNPDFHSYEFVEPDHPAGVATPEAVAAAARRAEREYPSKRLLIHFVQPHTPYLGPAGSGLNNGLSLSQLYRQTDTSAREIELAYRENLEIVLSVVRQLFSEFSGRFVVSADHGELLGERLRPIPVRDFGHPRGVYHDSLVTVPWHTFERGERRTVRAEPPVQTLDSSEDRNVQERLQALGYA